jgi:hypothetical protein
MKKYYISGTYYEDDYDENYEKIIEAENEDDAKHKVVKSFNFLSVSDVNIDQCYETTEDAMV